MKILGVIDDEKLIAEISRQEIHSVIKNADGGDVNLSSIRVGVDVDLAMGFKYMHEIKKICESVIKSNNSFIDRYDSFVAFASNILGDENAYENEKLDSNMIANMFDHKTRVDQLESALAAVLSVINEDKDGGYFICTESKPFIDAARSVLFDGENL